MKFNFLFIFLMICFLPTFSFAQELKFDIEISLITKNSHEKNSLPVNVKITNHSDKDLNVSELGGISFNFSKFSKTKSCLTRGDNYVASTGVKSKNLRNNESFEFEVNLAELYWNDAISNAIDFNYPNNFAKIPLSNKYLYAEIRVSDRFRGIDAFSINVSVYKSYKSNEIISERKQPSIK